MQIVRIEHGVDDFDAWKKVFDDDPLDRKGSGVQRYRVMRAVDDPNHVFVELEFDDGGKADAMLGSLRDLWSRVDIMRDPQGRIAEVVETKELA